MEPVAPLVKAVEERKGLFSGITPNVIRLGWVSLLADISSEMLYPVIPIFLTTVIGAPISALGFIEGTAEALASLLKVISGKLSDRVGARRPFVFGGYVLSAIARPITALASGWTLVLFSRSLDRVGKGLRASPRDALLADSVSSEYRGKAFGWHRGMDTLGAVIGPLAALEMISLFHGNLRWVFVVAFIPAILGAALVLTVRETEKDSSIHRSKPALNKSSIKSLPSGFWTYLIAWGVFSITNSSDMFILLRAKELGFDTTGTIFLYCFYNVIYAAASPGLGHLSDRIGRKKILVGGLLIFALVYLGFALSTERWQLWALFGMYGVYTGATDGVGKALAVDLVPDSMRGSAIGLLGAVTGITALVASSAAGILWSQLGSWATFGYGAVGAVLGAVLIAQYVSSKLN